MGEFSRGHLENNNHYDKEDKEWQIKLQMIDTICRLNPNERKNKLFLERESIETIRGKLGYLVKTKNNNSISVEEETAYDDFAFEERDYDEEQEDTYGFGR